MLLLVACLIGQFQPSDTESPAFEDFRAVCRELKREQIAAERELLEQMKPAAKTVISLSRSQKRQILDDVRVREDELERIEKDEKLLPAPQIIVQMMRVDQIGELFSRVSYADTSSTDRLGKKVSIERIETAPARFVVVKTFRPKAIVCACDGIEFVLIRRRGLLPAIGETIEPQGIYRISGTYTVAGKSLLAIEQWDRNTEWQKKTKRPEPSGRIEVAAKTKVVPQPSR